MRKKIIYVLLILSCPSLIFPQTTTELIEDIQQAFLQLDYQKAKQKAREVVQAWQQYEPSQLIIAHKILGVISYTEGNLNESQVQFEHVLSLDRSTTLDSVLISPKIITFFNNIKSEHKATASRSQTNHVRYLLIPDPRPGAALRSFVLPGWGQVYKGHKTKGITFLTATSVNIISSVTLYFLKNAAHNKYLNASTPYSIEQSYQDYNRLNKYWYSSMIVAGVIWISSFADALISKPTLNHNTTAHLIQPSFSKKEFNLTVAWHF